MTPSIDSPRVVEVIDTRAELPLSARVRLRTQARAELAPMQVRIGMLAMSILPADLLQLSGQYGVQAPLPYVPGHEGVAVVLEVGSQVSDLAVGQRVLPMGAGGLWADECVVHRRALVPVASDGDVLQQAMLTANPATAWVLLKHEGGIAPGQWLIQNAANSAMGQCVRLLAAHLGLNLINIVRRPQAIDASGGHWLVDEGQEPAALRAQVKAIAGEGAIVLALDAIGGSATESLAACLDEGARLLLYGLLSGQSSRIAAHDLVFRGVQVRGFWLARWFGDPAHRQISREVYPALMALAEQGVLRMAVEQVYDLDQVLPALAHAARAGRQGKILLRGAHGPLT